MSSDLLHRALVVEGLLNTLESERHLRRPLVAELVASLASLDSTWDAARESARVLLFRLENGSLTESDWRGALTQLRDDIGPPSSLVPRSSVVSVRPAAASEPRMAKVA